MIDIEVKIFNSVYPIAAPLCAKKSFVSNFPQKLTAFPTAALVELENSTVYDKKSSAMAEDFARLMYQLDVFAKTKTECRKVFAAIDAQMIRLNFTRMSGNFIPMPDNTSVNRYTARYEVMVDQDGVLYRAR